MSGRDLSPSTLAALKHRAQDIRHLYDQLNEESGRPAWNASAFTLGFAADVGSLAKLVLAREGLREVDDLDNRLAHELADCLWSILILADECDVDLETSFANTMDQLEASITLERRRTPR